jgi:CHAT domain
LAVSANATVKLVTAAARDIAGDANVGRAEALRRSMLALIDTGERHEAHPAYWAPFVVVGEGAVDITDSSATCHGISSGAPCCPRLLRYQSVEFG